MKNSETISEMKRLHELGLHPHWLHVKKKKPVDFGWTEISRKTVKGLMAQYRNGMNLGLRTGKAGNVYYGVIDLDVKSTDPKHREEVYKIFGTLFPQLRAKGTPYTISGRGNGSRHYHVKSLSPIPKRKVITSKDKVEIMTDGKLQSRAAWEIDILGESSNVVMPPSIHPDSKKAYKWGNKFHSLDDLPEIDFSKIKFPTKTETTKKTLDHKPFKEFTILESVELDDRGLSAEMKSAIIDGDDVTDGSSSLFSAMIRMIACNFTLDEILTVFTNQDYHLGQVAYNHAKTNDRMKAAKWLYQFNYIKALEKVESEKWVDDLAKTEKGGIKGTLNNIVLILKYAVNPKLFQYNEFSGEDVYGHIPPWGEHKVGEKLNDRHDSSLRKWFSEKFKLEVTATNLKDAIISISDENKFHPLKDYLETLEWDKKSRIENLFVDYIQSDSPLVYRKMIARKFLVGMVRRIFEPASKFDTILVLEGKQNIGKSTFARILASDEYFCDDLGPVDNKDTIMKLIGHWIIEIAELSSLKKSDLDAFKAFVTRLTDKIRRPYGKRLEDFPRQCVFIGTTNSDEYLKDSTGNRRFWPLHVLKCDLKKLKDDREQILAEAVHLYRKGVTSYLENEEEIKLAEIEQKKRELQDPWLDRILTYFLKKQFEGNNLNPKRFRLRELFEFGPLSNEKHDAYAEVRVANILKKLNGTKKKTGGLIYWSLPDFSKSQDGKGGV